MTPPHRPEPPEPLPNTIFYLTGVPAVGKYSIAREISRRTGAIIVDNQLINIPIFSVLVYDGKDSFPFPEAGWENIEAIRQAVLAAIRDLAPPLASFTLTNVLDLNDAGSATLFRQIEEIAGYRGALFVPVWVRASAESIRERKDAPERHERYKDTDLSTVDWWVDTFQPYREDHPNAVEIDTSDRTVAESAAVLLAHAGQLLERSDGVARL